MFAAVGWASSLRSPLGHKIVDAVAPVGVTEHHPEARRTVRASLGLRRIVAPAHHAEPVMGLLLLDEVTRMWLFLGRS